MLMYFEFNEDKLKENNLTKEQCFGIIDRFFNREGIYAVKQGVYIADEDTGFDPFGKLRVRLPRTSWFMKVIEKWFWFDDENEIDWNSKGEDCLYTIKIRGV